MIYQKFLLRPSFTPPSFPRYRGND